MTVSLSEHQKTFRKEVIAYIHKKGQDIKVLTVAGPNGAGKTTLIKGILKKFPGKFCEIKLITTGAPHGNDGARRFVSREAFLREKIVVGWAADRCESGYCLRDLMKAIKKNKIIIFEGMFRLEKIRNILRGKRIQSMIVGVLPPGKNLKEILKVLEIRLMNRIGCRSEEVTSKIIDARDRIMPNVLKKADIIIRSSNNRTQEDIIKVMKKWEEMTK